MASLSRVSLLTFPSEEELLGYLRSHPFTEDRAENLRKAVVPFFAGQSISKASVKERIIQVIGCGDCVQWERKVLIADFTKALIDCAKGVKSWQENYNPPLAAQLAMRHAFF